MTIPKVSWRSDASMTRTISWSLVAVAKLHDDAHVFEAESLNVKGNRHPYKIISLDGEDCDLCISEAPIAVRYYFDQLDPVQYPTD